MEGLRKTYRNLPLRKAFVLTVLTTFCVVVLLSGLCIGGCLKFRRFLLPDPREVMLRLKVTDVDGSVIDLESRIRLGEEMSSLPLLFEEADGELVVHDYDLSSMETSVVKVEKSYDRLTPRRKLAYRGCGILMVAFPSVLSVAGILFCGFFFYRQKLNEPLKLLSQATQRIAGRDLDFELSYGAEDEMGQLCRSFEQMRRALDENSRELWKVIEERKKVQASVAHDLRNPIAIIQGYAEYLQMNLQGGRLSTERIRQIADNVDRAAKRLEQYTESVRTVNQLEEIEVKRKQVSIGELVRSVREDCSLLAAAEKKRLVVDGGLAGSRDGLVDDRVEAAESKAEFAGGGTKPAGAGTELTDGGNELTESGTEIQGELICVDVPLLCRVLENVVSNALRYAKETVAISFELEDRFLAVNVTDDGAGFPDDVLREKNRLLLPAAGEDGHCGLGLTISRLLCQKHEGRLELSNRPSGGASVKIILGI